MTASQPSRVSLSAILDELREVYGIDVKGTNPVSGGDINQSYRLQTADRDLFLKFQPVPVPGMFAAEADGLEALRGVMQEYSGVMQEHSGATSNPPHNPPHDPPHDPASLRIPDIIAVDPDRYLLLEYIKTTPRTPASTSPQTPASTPPRTQTLSRAESFRNLGHGLARLHLRPQPHFGWHRDNFIGRLPQSNQPEPTFPEFFIRQRIEPQLRLAIDTGHLPATLLPHWSRLQRELPSIFPDTHPALTHGDLWSGNVMIAATGQPVLIDPAVAASHPETDLAMTRMFGGFPPECTRAYEEIRPLPPGFPRRAELYNLYPLLVHVNLFGGSYAHSAAALLKTY